MKLGIAILMLVLLCLGVYVYLYKISYTHLMKAFSKIVFHHPVRPDMVDGKQILIGPDGRYTH